MLNYLLNSGLSYTNYKMTNMPNIYNLLISIFNDLTDEEVMKYLDSIKLYVGNTFYNEFVGYIFKKMPNHRILKLDNKH